MMERINDGGPAFPRKGVRVVIPKELENNPYVQAIEFQEDGISIRDWLAGLAMQSILSVLREGIRPEDLKPMAKDSYAVADAMLKQREAK